jgi:hypothetical protein
MTELDADAERLLALTRQAHTPSAADKARVDRLLGGALLLGATSAHAASGSAAASKLPEELDLLHDAQTKWRAGNASAALALIAATDVCGGELRWKIVPSREDADSLRRCAVFSGSWR